LTLEPTWGGGESRGKKRGCQAKNKAKALVKLPQSGQKSLKKEKHGGTLETEGDGLLLDFPLRQGCEGSFVLNRKSQERRNSNLIGVGKSPGDRLQNRRKERESRLLFEYPKKGEQIDNPIIFSRV